MWRRTARVSDICLSYIFSYFLKFSPRFLCFSFFSQKQRFLCYHCLQEIFPNSLFLWDLWIFLCCHSMCFYLKQRFLCYWFFSSKSLFLYISVNISLHWTFFSKTEIYFTIYEYLVSPLVSENFSEWYFLQNRDFTVYSLVFICHSEKIGSFKRPASKVIKKIQILTTRSYYHALNKLLTTKYSFIALY